MHTLRATWRESHRVFLRCRRITRSTRGFALPLALLIFCAGMYATLRHSIDVRPLTLMWNDPLEYRSIAEHFWGVPHESDKLSIAWLRFLDTVPMREIIPGSYYLLAQRVHRLASSLFTFDQVYMVPLWLLLCGAYWALYCACRRAYGTVIAAASLLLLAVPLELWAMTEQVMTEPFLRIGFVFAAALLIRLPSSKHPMRLLPLIFLALLFCAQVKSQWWLLSPVMAAGALLFLHEKRLLDFRRALSVIALAICVPLSLATVHGIGWGVWSVMPGSGMHANVKSGGAYMHYVCEHEQQSGSMPAYCNAAPGDLDPYWQISVRRPTDWHAFDSYGIGYFASSPPAMLKDFWQGIEQATNFSLDTDLFRAAQPARNIVLLLVDTACWVLMFAGLLRRETRMLCAFGLCLWLIPAIGNVFSVYATRYHRPMAMLPVVIGIAAGCAYARAFMVRFRLMQQLRSLAQALRSSPSESPQY